MNDIIKGTIGVSLAVLLAVTLVLPVVISATDHTVVYENEPASGAYCMANANDTVTFTYDTENGYKINNVAITPFNATYTTLTSDNLAMRWAGGSPGIILLGESWTGAACSTFSLTATNGTITGTYATTADPDTNISVSTTYDTLYYQDVSGEYTMTKGGEAYYLAKDTEVMLIGFNSSLGAGNAGYFKLIGNITDGFTFSYNSGADVITEYTLNAELVEGTADIYKVTSIQFVISDNLTITVDRLVVPAEVTGTESYDYTAIDAMVNLLPLLVILGVVLGAVSIIARARLS